jgi:hypothetical protein
MSFFFNLAKIPGLGGSFVTPGDVPNKEREHRSVVIV